MTRLPGHEAMRRIRLAREVEERRAPRPTPESDATPREIDVATMLAAAPVVALGLLALLLGR